MERRDPEDKRPVIIMAQDEGRFGRITDIRTCWAPKGIRPTVARQVVRTFVYVYAAVCMALGKMTTLILPYANTEIRGQTTALEMDQARGPQLLRCHNGENRLWF